MAPRSAISANEKTDVLATAPGRWTRRLASKQTSPPPDRIRPLNITVAMVGQQHGFQVVLQRDSPAQPWGFRLQGGRESQAPLTIQRVSDHIVCYLI